MLFGLHNFLSVITLNAIDLISYRLFDIEARGFLPKFSIVLFNAMAALGFVHMAKLLAQRYYHHNDVFYGTNKDLLLSQFHRPTSDVYISGKVVATESAYCGKMDEIDDFYARDASRAGPAAPIPSPARSDSGQTEELRKVTP